MGSSVFIDNETPLSAANLNKHVAGDGLANVGNVALGGASGLFWDDTLTRLGRGTQSPAAALDWLDGAGALSAILSTNADADVTLWLMGDRDASGAGTRAGFVALDYSADVLKIGRGADVDAATAYVALASTGRVGIGTAAPEEIVHVGDGNVNIDRYGTALNFRLRRASGTQAAPTATTTGSSLGSIGGAGHDGTVWVTGFRTRMTTWTTENYTASAQGARLEFATTPNGSTSNAVRLRLEHDGKIAFGANAPGSPLEMDLPTADLEIVDAGTAGGTNDGWIEMQIGNSTKFIRCYNTK